MHIYAYMHIMHNKMARVTFNVPAATGSSTSGAQS